MSDPVLVLREALAKATEGPWEVQRNDVKGFDIWKQRGTYVAAGLMDGAIEDEPDAEFILAARNLLPVLLDEAEALRKVVDGVKALPGVWKREASRLIERAERCSLEDFIRSERLIERATALADAAGATARLLAVLDKEEEK